MEANGVLYTAVLLYFESRCGNCGGVARAVLERHSPVWIEASLHWQCTDECYEASPIIEQRNGQSFKDFEDLRPLFRTGHLVDVLRDGSLRVSENLPFDKALSWER